MDTKIYPILELYRHGFELMTKSICDKLNFVLLKNDLLKFNHNVNELWKTLFPLIKLNFGEMPMDMKLAIEKTLFTLNEHNHNSQMFRYPTDKTGKFISLEKLELMNYLDLKKEIENSYIMISQLDEFITDVYENKCESAQQGDAPEPASPAR